MGVSASAVQVIQAVPATISHNVAFLLMPTKPKRRNPSSDEFSSDASDSHTGPQFLSLNAI